VSATTDNVVLCAARRPRLNRLLELLRKRRRNRPANGESRTGPFDGGVFADADMYGDRFSESEIIFMSMMWMGM
jgi:hypothetical protein